VDVTVAPPATESAAGGRSGSRNLRRRHRRARNRARPPIIRLPHTPLAVAGANLPARRRWQLQAAAAASSRQSVTASR